MLQDPCTACIQLLIHLTCKLDLSLSALCLHPNLCISFTMILLACFARHCRAALVRLRHLMSMSS